MRRLVLIAIVHGRDYADAHGSIEFHERAERRGISARYDTFFAVVASDAVRFRVYSWDALNWWLDDQPIIERLPSGRAPLTATMSRCPGAITWSS